MSLNLSVINTWHTKLTVTDHKSFQINLENCRSSFWFIYSLKIILYVYLVVHKSVEQHMRSKYTPWKITSQRSIMCCKTNIQTYLISVEVCVDQIKEKVALLQKVCVNWKTNWKTVKNDQEVDSDNIGEVSELTNLLMRISISEDLQLISSEEKMLYQLRNQMLYQLRNQQWLTI